MSGMTAIFTDSECITANPEVTRFLCAVQAESFCGFHPDFWLCGDLKTTKHPLDKIIQMRVLTISRKLDPVLSASFIGYQVTKAKQQAG